MSQETRTPPEPAIVIPVGDWVDEYMTAEPELTTEAQAIQEQQSGGYGPAKMGRFLAIAKMRAEGFDGLPEHKPMLNLGYAHDWSQRLVNQKEKVKLESGKEITVNSLIGPVRLSVPPQGDGDEDEPQLALDMDTGGSGGADSPGGPGSDTTDDNPAFVRWDDPLGVERAEQYLKNRVPGHIYNRLKIIAANRGDVQAAVNDLHQKIDEMAGRLV